MTVKPGQELIIETFNRGPITLLFIARLLMIPSRYSYRNLRSSACFIG